MIRFLADHDFNDHVVRGLRLRLPGVDLVRLRDLGMQAVPDPTVLALAAADGRVVLTRDRRTMPGFAYARVAAGEPMPGVLVADSHAPVRLVIDDLVLVALSSDPADWADRVASIPFPKPPGP